MRQGSGRDVRKRAAAQARRIGEPQAGGKSKAFQAAVNVAQQGRFAAKEVRAAGDVEPETYAAVARRMTEIERDPGGVALQPRGQPAGGAGVGVRVMGFCDETGQQRPGVGKA